MQIEFKVHTLESSDAIKSYATEKMSKLEKYLRPPAEAHATFAVERRIHCVDISLHAGGEHYMGRADGDDMYASIDIVIDKLLRQLHRTRDQHANHRRGPQAGDSSPRE